MKKKCLQIFTGIVIYLVYWILDPDLLMSHTDKRLASIIFALLFSFWFLYSQFWI